MLEEITCKACDGAGEDGNRCCEACDGTGMICINRKQKTDNKRGDE